MKLPNYFWRRGASGYYHGWGGDAVIKRGREWFSVGSHAKGIYGPFRTAREAFAALGIKV